MCRPVSLFYFAPSLGHRSNDVDSTPLLSPPALRGGVQMDFEGRGRASSGCLKVTLTHVRPSSLPAHRYGSHAATIFEPMVNLNSPAWLWLNLHFAKKAGNWQKLENLPFMWKIVADVESCYFWRERSPGKLSGFLSARISPPISNIAGEYNDDA